MIGFEISLPAIAWGLFAFLVAWSGKHFLDRLVLPHVIDWWARQSKQSALGRAEKLLKSFRHDAKVAADLREVVIRAGMLTNVTVVLTGASIVFAITVAAAFRSYGVEESQFF